ncbi:MAG: hypothetical protein F4244_01210 [Gammaproteobacteria bacterium]|nr:hypothetical protein [Gammaproteobacteria bacterium]
MSLPNRNARRALFSMPVAAWIRNGDAGRSASFDFHGKKTSFFKERTCYNFWIHEDIHFVGKQALW